MILNIGDSSEKIFRAEKNILEMYKPSVWNIYVDGNMEREMEIEFEKFLINVGEHSNLDIDEISVTRFYSLLEYLKQKYPKK